MKTSLTPKDKVVLALAKAAYDTFIKHFPIAHRLMSQHKLKRFFVAIIDGTLDVLSKH